MLEKRGREEDYDSRKYYPYIPIAFPFAILSIIGYLISVGIGNIIESTYRDIRNCQIQDRRKKLSSIDYGYKELEKDRKEGKRHGWSPRKPLSPDERRKALKQALRLNKERIKLLGKLEGLSSED